ncbi:DNA N-6-adenine-methyltransferase [Nevskia sp.]|uniref:DNA N-6-adenine-methyltransferase n=1 Tax=Nevskia sp. TaxID=1929292 RepID=UPI0025EFF38F|nr:DNA N-6-adenine-methyltransferase [Nevskia sp.]
MTADLLGDAVTSRLGVGGHQSARMDEETWLTPPHILLALGAFDLDPCAPAIRPWDMAAKHYSRADDGLTQPWDGRVWLNPPYGAATANWMRRLAAHGNGVALIFARTETAAWTEHVWPVADAVLFLAKRLTFHRVDGKPAQHNGGAPSALIAYGSNNVDALRLSGLEGTLVAGWHRV